MTTSHLAAAMRPLLSFKGRLVRPESVHPRESCARVPDGTQASTARERLERRAATKRFVADADTSNSEIDLIGRALASPAERHSRVFARCP